MRSLISLVCIFCLSYGHSMAQENIKPEVLNITSEQPINDAKAVNSTNAKPLSPETLVLVDTPIQIPDIFIGPIKPVRIQELWHGSIYSSTYKAGVCIEPDGKLQGVLKLRTARGDIDTYHFYGNFNYNKIYARHGSGHTFNGSFISDKNVSGKITLKNGHSVTLTGERNKNVQLTNTCAPLSKD